MFTCAIATFLMKATYLFKSDDSPHDWTSRPTIPLTELRSSSIWAMTTPASRSTMTHNSICIGLLCRNFTTFSRVLQMNVTIIIINIHDMYISKTTTNRKQSRRRAQRRQVKTVKWTKPFSATAWLQKVSELDLGGKVGEHSTMPDQYSRSHSPKSPS